MANDGQIVFEVTADGKHAISDIKDITRAIEKEAGKWDDAAKQSTDNISGHFSGMLKKLVAGFSAVKIGKALLDIGAAAVEAASDLEEVQNVVDVTFGDSAGVIEKWAKNAGSQFGLTETQAKRFSSTMGAMLKSSGLAGDQIVKVSTDLAGLAADMASFYNLDFDEAFSKIRSGMSGMTMPLKELGIDMSVTTMNAFAMAQGLNKSFDQMSQGEQTMLRYQYLMQATADAQGDFSRTLDGFANTRRKFETNIESIKAALGENFKGVVTEAMQLLNGFLEMLIPQDNSTVLDDFATIDLNTQTKLEEIQKIKDEAELTTSVLEEMFGSGEEGQTAADIVSKYGVKSKEASEYLQTLGFSTDEINEKQETWLETCRRLVKTIPGLNEIINTETGEVKGGTKAIYDYVDAWEKGQEKLVMLGALEQKETALSERFSDLPGLKLDAALAEKKVRDQANAIRALYKKYGIREDLLPVGSKVKTTEGYYRNLPIEHMREINGAVMVLEELITASETANEKYKTQADALAEAKIALQEYRETIEETYGSIDKSSKGMDEWSDELKEAAKLLVSNAQTALTELEDYASGINKSITKAIDSTVTGFEAIETPMMKNRKKVKDLEDSITKLDSKSKTYKDDLKKINDEIAKQRGDQLSTQSMTRNLKQQADFMETYLVNLRRARALGFSNELLASLSDGSEESYDYLEQLAQASPKEVEEINKNFDKVIEKKKQLSDELTGQQLSVDKTYQSLADKAKEAVAALDMEGDAATNSGNTVKGIAKGIADHVPEVQAAVDSIEAQLNRLSAWNIDVDLGGFGKINLVTPSGTKERTRNGVTEGTALTGLDFVPHDNFYARLHEGERVLTAQENQIWNALRNGGIAGFDMETLGGVMRDNVKAGGNVYLDGKAVGNVISERQGKNYKSLQRSGWQA